MKLPIKKKYFDAIKNGNKLFDYRDAHITFVCEETGETLRKDITGSHFTSFDNLPVWLRESGLFEDETIIVFGFGDMNPKVSNRK